MHVGVALAVAPLAGLGGPLGSTHGLVVCGRGSARAEEPLQVGSTQVGLGEPLGALPGLTAGSRDSAQAVSAL